MKKHEMVLDFTSLLDVILIILFLVLCSMNGKAQKDAKKIDDLEASAAALTSENEQMKGQIDDLEKQNKELADLLEEARKASLEKGQEVDRLTAENQKLEELLKTATQLAKTYEKLNNLSPVDAKRFEILQGNSVSIEIELKDPNENTNPGHQCQVTLLMAGLRRGSYLIEDTYDSKLLVDSNVEKLTAWILSEISELKRSGEANLFFLGMPSDRSTLSKTANLIVDEAIKGAMQQETSIIMYIQGK